MYIFFAAPNFPSCVILISKSKNCAATKLAKQINILWTKTPFKEKMMIILKGFIKQPVVKQSSPVFLFSLADVWFIFLFPYRSICKIEKVDKISSSSF